MDNVEQVDVVVVGLGTSGAVVAARLSEDAGCSVLALEAGPDFPDERANPPGFLSGGNLFGEYFTGGGAPLPELDWGYYSEPLENGRRVFLRRGRLVGGTSMINGCIAVRGKPSDFEEWERLGARGWSWADVLPYFDAVEREVPIKRYPPERWQPLQRAFVEGFEELGLRRVEDMNAPESWEGVVGAWPQNRRNEVRHGTLVNYVRNARGRPNFRVVDRAVVDRVIVRRGRAIGVRYVGPDGPREVHADLIVVSAGSYGSPAILLRSGIGPADELRALGIEPLVDLPVGRGLRDHPQCVFLLESPPEVAELGGPSLAVVARGSGWFSFPIALDEENGVCGISFALTAQEPQGALTLRSADPLAPPLIDQRFQDVVDSTAFDEPWQVFRELAATRALAGRGLRGGDLERPLRDALLERLGIAFHPACTCAIGQVVDEHLAVRGVEGLLVADASIFPANVTNNTNHTCLMIGEVAAAKIRAGAVGGRPLAAAADG